MYHRALSGVAGTLERSTRRTYLQKLKFFKADSVFSVLKGETTANEYHDIASVVVQ
jgi:hypothetical protein